MAATLTPTTDAQGTLVGASDSFGILSSASTSQGSLSPEGAFVYGGSGFFYGDGTYGDADDVLLNTTSTTRGILG